MSELVLPVAGVPDAALVTRVRDAALSALRGHPETMVAGLSGVKTIEIAWPQAAPVWARAYRKEEIPAIAVHAQQVAREQSSTMEWLVTVRVIVIITTQGADNQDLGDAHAHLQAACLNLLAWYKNSDAFVEGYCCDSAVFGESAGQIALDDRKKNLHQLVSQSSTDFGIRCSVGG